MPKREDKDSLELTNELVEQEETKLSAIRSTLAIGVVQLDNGEFVDGEGFISDLILKTKSQA